MRDFAVLPGRQISGDTVLAVPIFSKDTTQHFPGLESCLLYFKSLLNFYHPLISSNKKAWTGLQYFLGVNSKF